MVKKILIGLLAVIALFAGFVATRPPDFVVTRSAVMNAPASKVFAQVNDFHAWEEWSPWAKRDPSAKSEFSGPSSGTTASFHWDGNKEVGAGGMTIVESRPYDLIRIRLDFEKPMKGTNMAEYTFQEENKQTTMTWTMTGKKNFLSKAICMFMDMDKMVGGDFEKGLASIKEIVEKK